MQPTGQPTGQPSGQPTGEPSSSPTSTYYPSAAPSTYKPTSMPTTEPSSSSPTSAPSLEPGTKWLLALVDLVRRLHASHPSSATGVLDYMGASQDGVSLTGTDGCGDWMALTAARLSQTAALFNYQSMAYAKQEHDYTDVHHVGEFPPVYACADVDKTAAILRALAGKGAANETCGGVDWRVRYCTYPTHGSSLVPVLCVNDTLGMCATVNSTVFCDVSRESGPTSMAPCSATNLRSATGLEGLSIGLAARLPAPNAQHASLLSLSKTAATVNVTFEGSPLGVTYCKAYPPSVEPTGVNDVRFNAYSAYIVNGSALVDVLGLTPLSSYSVYCVGVGSNGAEMSLAAVQRTRVNITTACCKALTVTLIQSELPRGGLVLDVLQFRLAVPSTADLSITVSTTAASNSSIAESLFLPAVTTMTHPQTTAALVMSVADSATPGDYALTVTLSGASVHEYDFPVSVNGGGGLLNATTGTVLVQVVGSRTSLNPPASVTASFSAQGSSVDVTLNTAGDGAGYPIGSAFSCSSLLEYAEMANMSIWAALTDHTCKWADATTLSIIPKNKVGAVQLTPAFSVRFNADVQLTAACPAIYLDSECALFGSTNAPATSLVAELTAPTTAVRPTVTVMANAFIGHCDELSVSVAADGSGGRDWVSSSALATAVRTVDGAVVNGTKLALLQTFLDEHSAEDVFVIDAELLEEGSIYAIELQVCNFLTQCDVGSSQIVVMAEADSVGSLPTASIIGGSTMREHERSRVLRVRASAAFPVCGGEARIDKLTFSWKVTRNGAQEYELVSGSPDRSLFSLPAYTLETGGTYTLTATVGREGSSLVAIASIDVTVVPGELSAVISGGKNRVLIPNKFLSLDGSASIDAAVQGTLGEAAVTDNYAFEWSCLQLAPGPATSCDDIFEVTPGEMTTPYVRVNYLNTVAGSVAKAQFTLRVSDIGSGSSIRASEASVVVDAVSAGSPEVAITRTPAADFDPTEDKLVVAGSVAMYDLAGTMGWSVSPAVDLSLASSPVTRTLPRSTRPYIVSLVLPPNTLPSRTTFTFTLRAFNGATEEVANSVTVVTNGPPLPGTVSVTPSIGTELLTDFTLVSNHWNDQDVPLVYAFGTREDGRDTILVPRAESQRTTLVFAAGAVDDDFSKICIFLIFDALGAVTTESTTFIVTEIGTEADDGGDGVHDSTASSRLDAIDSFLSDKLAAVGNASTSVSPMEARETSTFIASASAALNRLDCSLPEGINCTALNRDACGTTSVARTCGECFSGHVGQEGAASVECVDPLAAVAAGNDTVAAPVMQSCPADCSNQGSCMFVDTSRIPIDTCYVGDACTSSCVCDDSYAGEACSLSSQDLQKKRDMRQAMVEQFATISVAFAEATPENVDERLDNIQLLTRSRIEMSPTAKSRVLALLEATLKDAMTSGSVDIKRMDVISRALDIAMDVTTTDAAGNEGSRRRRLESSSEAPAVLNHTSTVLSLTNLATSYMGFLEPTEEDVLRIKSASRVSARAVSLDSTDSSASNNESVQSVLLSAETSTMLLFDAAQTALTVTLPITTDSLSSPPRIALSSIQPWLAADLTAARFNASDLLSSVHIVQAELSDDAASCNDDDDGGSDDVYAADDPRFITLVVQHTTQQAYGELVDQNRTVLALACEKGVVHNETRLCHGHEVFLSCDGSSNGEARAMCFESRRPFCEAGVLAGVKLPYRRCITVDYTAFNTTCACKLCTDSSNSRRLSSSGRPFSSIDVSVVNDFHSVVSLRQMRPTPIKIERQANYFVLAAFACLWMAILCVTLPFKYISRSLAGDLDKDASSKVEPNGHGDADAFDYVDLDDENIMHHGSGIPARLRWGPTEQDRVGEKAAKAKGRRELETARKLLKREALDKLHDDEPDRELSMDEYIAFHKERERRVAAEKMTQQATEEPRYPTRTFKPAPQGKWRADGRLNVLSGREKDGRDGGVTVDENGIPVPLSKEPWRVRMSHRFEAYLCHIFPGSFSDRDTIDRLGHEMHQHHLFVKCFARVSARQRLISAVEVLTLLSLGWALAAVLLSTDASIDRDMCRGFSNQQECLTDTGRYSVTQSVCSWVAVGDGNEYLFGPYHCTFEAKHVPMDTIVVLVGVVIGVVPLLKYVIAVLVDVVRAPRAGTADHDHLLDAKGLMLARKGLLACWEEHGHEVQEVTKMEGALRSMRRLRRLNRENAGTLNVLSEQVSGDALLRVKLAYHPGDLGTDVDEHSHKDFSNLNLALADHVNACLEKDRRLMLRNKFRFRSKLFEDSVLQSVESPDAMASLFQSSWFSSWGLHVPLPELGTSEDNASIMWDQSAVMCRRMQESRAVSRTIYDNMKDLRVPDDVIGAEVLRLFVVDMLGRDTEAARLYWSSSRHPQNVTDACSNASQGCAWAVLVAINATAIAACTIIASDNNQPWFFGFLWMGLILSTYVICFDYSLEAFVTGFGLPALIRRRVLHCRDQLKRSFVSLINRVRLDGEPAVSEGTGVDGTDAGAGSSYNVDTDDANEMGTENDNATIDDLSASHFLFSSHRLAGFVPSLPEALLVLSYRCPDPGLLGADATLQRERQSGGDASNKSGYRGSFGLSTVAPLTVTAARAHVDDHFRDEWAPWLATLGLVFGRCSKTTQRGLVSVLPAGLVGILSAVAAFTSIGDMGRTVLLVVMQLLLVLSFVVLAVIICTAGLGTFSMKLQVLIKASKVSPLDIDLEAGIKWQERQVRLSAFDKATSPVHTAGDLENNEQYQRLKRRKARALAPDALMTEALALLAMTTDRARSGPNSFSSSSSSGGGGGSGDDESDSEEGDDTLKPLPGSESGPQSQAKHTSKSNYKSPAQRQDHIVKKALKAVHRRCSVLDTSAASMEDVQKMLVDVNRAKELAVLSGEHFTELEQLKAQSDCLERMRRMSMALKQDASKGALSDRLAALKQRRAVEIAKAHRLKALGGSIREGDEREDEYDDDDDDSYAEVRSVSVVDKADSTIKPAHNKDSHERNKRNILAEIELDRSMRTQKVGANAKLKARLAQKKALRSTQVATQHFDVVLSDSSRDDDGGKGAEISAGTGVGVGAGRPVEEEGKADGASVFNVYDLGISDSSSSDGDVSKKTAPGEKPQERMVSTFDTFPGAMSSSDSHSDMAGIDGDYSAPENAIVIANEPPPTPTKDDYVPPPSQITDGFSLYRELIGETEDTDMPADIASFSKRGHETQLLISTTMAPDESEASATLRVEAILEVSDDNDDDDDDNNDEVEVEERRVPQELRGKAEESRVRRRAMREQEQEDEDAARARALAEQQHKSQTLRNKAEEIIAQSQNSENVHERDHAQWLAAMTSTMTTPSPLEKRAEEKRNERRTERVLRKNQREEKRRTKAQRVKDQRAVDAKMRLKLAAKGVMTQKKVAKKTAKMADIAEAAAIAKYERLFGKSAFPTLYDPNDDAPVASSSDGGGSTGSSDFDNHR